MALTRVPAGHIATIVTSLEMRERPRPAPLPHAPLRLVKWEGQAPDKYRTLFRRIGEPWLWFSRLELDDLQLSAIIHSLDVDLYAVIDPKGIEVGILELDFRTHNQCELAFLGLIPELAGQGFGRWLMAHALIIAWSRKSVERVWVHTCTLDHPGALRFYQRSGFRAFETLVETFPDPRVIGIHPVDAAPHVPFIQP